MQPNTVDFVVTDPPYGLGFPKSLDSSKALDKAAGAEREVVGRRSQPDIRGDSYQDRQRHGKAGNVEILDTVPAHV